MPFNLNHIAGLCLSVFKMPHNLAATILMVIFLISLFKIFLSQIKIFFFKRKLIIVKTPKIIRVLMTKHHLSKHVLVINDKKPTAFCFGIKKPTIYISASLVSLLNKKELEAVILHEKYHYLHKDTIWMFLISIIKEFFFFIPVFSDFIGGIVRKKEVMADRYSVQSLGGNRAIIQSFRKLLLLKSSGNYPYDYIPSFSHIHTVEYRIKVLHGQKSSLITFKKAHIVTTFLFIAFFLVLSILPSNKSQALERPNHTVCSINHP